MKYITLEKKSLRHRVLRAGAWTFVGHVTSQSLRLGSNLILTRLLMPEMFGIMALANVLLLGLTLMSDLGLRQNIVQSQNGHDPVFLNTVWSIQILRGGLIWAIALVMAFALYLLGMKQWLPATSVYAEPLLPYIIALLSFNAIINGLEPTKIATASRNLAVGKLTMIELISQASGITFMLAWAFLERSIWALVAGSLFTSLLRVFLGNVLLPGERNRLHWDKNAIAEILGFGKWIFLTSILGFLAANGDRLVLGGLVDSKILGIYSIAFLFVNTFTVIFSNLVGNVAFPALSEVKRERPTTMKHIYYKFRQPLDRVMLLANGLLFVAGHWLVIVLYDPRYFLAGKMLEILSISLFEARYQITGQCYMALGKPKLLVPLIGIKVASLYLVLPVVFAYFGLNGALWVIGGSALLTLPLNFYYKYKLKLLDISQEFLALPWLVYGLAAGWAVNQAAVALRWHI